MVRSVSKGGWRRRERESPLSRFFSSNSADIKTWQTSVSALVQHRTSPHKANTVGCARLDRMEEITNSSQAVTWARALLDVPTEECFWKISSCCLRQQQSYADETLPPAGTHPTSMRGLSTDTAASTEPLCSPPQNHHPSLPKRTFKSSSHHCHKKKKKRESLVK